MSFCVKLRLGLSFCLLILVRVRYVSYFVCFWPFCRFFLYHIMTLSVEKMFSDCIVVLVFA